MTTVAEVILLALKDIGVLDEDETPSSSLLADAFTTLKQMLSLWQTSNIYVYAKEDITFTPDGSLTYTIGPTGADITNTTPQRIAYAFHAVGDISYPMLKIFERLEDYQNIGLKNLVSYPSSLFYNPLYPNGTIYLYPAPNTGTMHLGIDVSLPEYTATTDNISLPAEYDMAVRFNLAVILAPMLGKQVDPYVEKMAKNSLQMVKANNLEIRVLNERNSESRMARFNRG